MRRSRDRPGDDAPKLSTVVLSHGYWQRRFAARTDIVGQSITIENAPGRRRAVAGLSHVRQPVRLVRRSTVFLPLEIDGNEDIGGFIAAIGQLRSGVTVSQAKAELASRQSALSVGKWTWMTVLAQQVTPLVDLVTRDVRSPVLLLCAGIGCVLLMASTDLANPLPLRASGKRREKRLRTALGASISQVLGQMTAKSAVLVATGGLAAA